MDTTLLLLGAIGGLLPDVIRIMKDPNSIKEYAGVKIVSLILQIALGVFAVWLLLNETALENVSKKLIAVTLGFAAPEILTRTLSALASLIGGAPASEEPKSKGFDMGEPKKSKSLMEWWGE